VPAPPRFEVPRARLERWIERWAGEHGGVVRTFGGTAFAAADGSVLCAEPPLGPLAPGAPDLVAPGLDLAPLRAHLARERTVGVLLVRLGGHAAGVFSGERLVRSKVGRRHVHGRHRAGGSSQARFARRRAGEERVALAAAADDSAPVLTAQPLDALVLGGDRAALRRVLADPRLAPLAPLAVPRVLDVPDPRLAVLRATPAAFLATVLREEALLAFYGTLMSGLPPRPGRPALEGRVVPLAPCLLPGRLWDVGPYPALTAGEEPVRGELVRTAAPDALAVLDAWEGVEATREGLPPLYRRERVRLLDPPLDAWVYRWAGSTEGLAALPGGDWRAHVAGR